MAAWRAYAETVVDLNAALEADLAPHGLTLGDYQVLVHLSEADDHAMRMCDLAAPLQLSPSGLTRRLDGLVRMGVVERRPSDARPPGDARRAHRPRHGVPRAGRPRPRRQRAPPHHRPALPRRHGGDGAHLPARSSAALREPLRRRASPSSCPPASAATSPTSASRTTPTTSSSSPPTRPVPAAGVFTPQPLRRPERDDQPRATSPTARPRRSSSSRRTPTSPTARRATPTPRRSSTPSPTGSAAQPATCSSPRPA